MAQINEQEVVDYRELLAKAPKRYKLKTGELVRFEVADDHHYFIFNEDYPRGKYMPGVTTILDEAGPVAFGLKKFWKDNTAQDADQILDITGRFGSKIHDACEQLLNGVNLKLHQDYPSFSEQRALVTFASWFRAAQPTSFQSEQTIASAKYMYAGTLDFVGQIERKRAAVLLGLNKGDTERFIDGQPEKIERWLIDFKTSSGIRYNHQLQVIAYKQAYEESYGITIDRIGILRLGARSKIGFEFKEVKGSIDRFMNVYNVFLDLHNGEIPEPKEVAVFPEMLQLYESEAIDDHDLRSNAEPDVSIGQTNQGGN